MTTPDPTASPVQAEATLPLAAPAFVAGPLVMLAGRVLLDPLGDADWDKTLSAVAAHRGRSDAGWLLAFLGCALLAYGSIALVQRLAVRGARAAPTVLGLLLPLGWTACAAICVAGLAMGTSAVRPERETMVAWQEAMSSSTSVALLFFVTVVAGFGYLWLALALARRGVLGRGSAALIGLGGLTTLVTMPGPVKPALIVTATLLAAGHALAVRPSDAATPPTART